MPSFSAFILALALACFAPLASAPSLSAAEPDRKIAETHVAAGAQALKESDGAPQRIVDAALEYAQALKIYEKLGDTDAVCDMQANVFWCKKRMNLENLQDYVAKKTGDQAQKAALATVNEVAEKKVDASEADQYFARAEKFAKANQDKPLPCSIRYYEVAERFTGSDLAIKAQKLSLEYKQKHMKTISDTVAGLQKDRETLFTKPTLAASGAKGDVPAADKQKSSIAEMRKLYSADYAKSKPAQKRAFAAKLLKEARATKDDHTLRYGLLSEAQRLAASTESHDILLSAIDLQAATFTGVDATAEKKAALAKLTSSAVAKNIIKLLDDARNAEANSIVGRYFAVQAADWDKAVPMLALGAEGDFKKLAEMEIAKPDGASQQAEIGDGWYDLGKKARTPDREAWLGRAQMWYQMALPKLTGISKEKTTQRMAEIDGLLPMTKIDFATITEKQWDRLRGVMVAVEAKKDRTDTGVLLGAGKRVRVVPHPTDKWSFTSYSGQLSMTWKGTDRRTYYYSGDFNYGALGMWVESGAKMKPGIVDAPGRLFLGPAQSDAYYQYDGTGAIRVKIIPVEEE